MRFDQEKLQPTYQLDLGFPGNSYALDIAKEYHSPENIVARARELIDQKSLQLSELLKKLSSRESTFRKSYMNSILRTNFLNSNWNP